MLLKMKTGLAGPDLSLSPGDEHDFTDEDEAQRLIDAEFAEPAEVAPVIPEPPTVDVAPAAPEPAPADVAPAAPEPAPADVAPVTPAPVARGGRRGRA